MAQTFQINGPTLVKLSGPFAAIQELGLADGEITITVDFNHEDIHADDFGPNVPPDVIWMGATATISMTMVYYDSEVLGEALACSMANANAAIGEEGTFNSIGTIMGAQVNNYITLSLTSPVGQLPWQFPATYLTGPPMELPLGSARSLTKLKWRAVPYTPLTVTTSSSGGSQGGATTTTPNECISRGAVLWTHTAA